MMHKLIITLTTLFPLAHLIWAEEPIEDPIQLSPFVAHSQRVVSNSGATLSYADLISSEEIAELAPHDISDLLFADPSITSFRNYANRVAHPASQGLRIRNIGANATSRALVMFDGVPQNDPFGGWIYWNRYNPASVGSINVSASGNNEVWGNYGAGGLVSIYSNYAEQTSQNYSLFAGSDGSFGGSFGVDTPLSEEVVFTLQGRYHDADGHNRIHPDQRGPIDINADSESKSLRGQLAWKTASEWELKATLDLFEEDRSNGNPLTDNDTEAVDFSAQAYKQLDESSAIQIIAYYQDRDFKNVFSSVSDERDSERPALDQYDVPADAIGASFSYSHDLDSIRYITGLDYRHITGSVNERYRNLGAGFTRNRYAGGEQDIFGAFLGLEAEATERTGFGASFRIDQIRQTDGLRIETNTETDTVIRNDALPNKDDWEHSINLSALHQFNDTTKGRIVAFTGFRAPTLNELYRPFRVKNDIVEANTDLEQERFNGIEANLQYSNSGNINLDVSIFHYELDDLIANALLHTNSGFDPIVGFVPNGGSASQRRNIEESTSTGVELGANLIFNEAWSADFKYTYSRSEIQKNDVNPDFNGKDLPQSPRHRAFAQLNWAPEDNSKYWVRITTHEEQYEDLLNSRRIAGATTVDLGASFTLNENNSLSVRLENATDELIETGLSTNGLISIGVPRSAWIQWNYRH